MSTYINTYVWLQTIIIKRVKSSHAVCCNTVVIEINVAIEGDKSETAQLSTTQESSPANYFQMFIYPTRLVEILLLCLKQ